MQANKDVRFLARGKGVPFWRIAQEIGVSEPTLTRWLRVPLEPNKRTAIIGAIEKLSNEE